MRRNRILVNILASTTSTGCRCVAAGTCNVGGNNGIDIRIVNTVGIYLLYIIYRTVYFYIYVFLSCLFHYIGYDLFRRIDILLYIRKYN